MMTMMVVVVMTAMADVMMMVMVMMMVIGGGNDSNGRCDDNCAHRKDISWHPVIRPRCVLVLNHLSWNVYVIHIYHY